MYVTDSLQLSEQRRYIAARYADIISGNVDTRTGDEIAVDIVTRACLVFEKGDEQD